MRKSHCLKIGLNGLLMDGGTAFYAISKGMVILDVAFTEDGNSELPEYSEEWLYYKGREAQLTKNYARLYCKKHSRRLDNGVCDICESIKNRNDFVI